MSLPQHISYGEGGNVYIDLLSLPSQVTVAVYDFDGTLLQDHGSSNISFGAINTYINNASTKGDTALNVASNTGISVGKVLRLQDDPEDILVKKVDGATVYLRRPLLYDHVVNAVVEGCRIDFAIGSNVANSFFWDARCEWNIDGRKEYTAIECTRWPMPRRATAVDWSDEEPKLYDLIDDEADIERMLDLGHQDVMSMISKIAPDARVRVFTDSQAFKQATIYAAQERLYRRQMSIEGQEIKKTYAELKLSEVTTICTVIPRDSDQDGVVEEDEKIAVRTITLKRR